jgi:hypothetical protein
MQKIGYSFVGLLAGNVAMLGGLFLMAAYSFLLSQGANGGGSKIVMDWTNMPVLSVLDVIYSCVGWVIIGLPAVLLMPGQFMERIRGPWTILFGATLGPLALLLIFISMGHGQLDIPAIEMMAPFWLLSILASTTAFVVYCALMRRALRETA